jgi:hypothetical protein
MSLYRHWHEWSFLTVLIYRRWEFIIWLSFLVLCVPLQLHWPEHEEVDPYRHSVPSSVECLPQASDGDQSFGS